MDEREECKVIVVTGIPGSGSTDFCRRYIAAATLLDLRAKTYNMGDMLLRMAQKTPQKPPLPAENLLNLQPEYLGALRDRVFDAILDEVERDRDHYDRLIIDMHCQFFWNDIFTNAYDWSYLRHLDADMFVTLIEKPSTIKARQMATPQGLCQNHSLRDLLLWQNVEVNVAEGFATNLGIPHYVLPGRQDPLTVESLLFNAFLIYFQMPMTDASSEADAMISAFKEKLLDIGRKLTGLPTPLIDPRTIDIESGEGLSVQEEWAIRVHTVHRDLNLYIPKSSDQVAYYPPGTMLSKGVGDESTRGHETGNFAFVVYPSKHVSPFMDIATKVFFSEVDFLNFYPEYMKKRLETLQRGN